MPEPGPGEYSPEKNRPYYPAYSMRLKLDHRANGPAYPGPGHYDVDSSTIGNWGAGMEAHVSPKRDIFLSERIETFRRGALHATDRKFLADNRAKVMELRKVELGARDRQKASRRDFGQRRATTR
jgi:hypothetical protein